MARRKRILEDDDDSDSSAGSDSGNFDLDNDPDTREERALFEDPYQRKRRRKNGKDDAIYGTFGENSEDESRGTGGLGSAGRGGKKSDWTKAPAFVSGEKVDLDKEMEPNIDKDDDDDDDDEDDDESEDEGDSDEEDGEEEPLDESEPSRPPSPRIREESVEEPERPRMGLGKSKPPDPPSAFPKGGIGSSRAAPQETFSGPSRGGIGSSRPTAPTSALPVAEDLPAAFGSRTRGSFVRDTTGSIPSMKPAAPLSAAELAHFNKLQGSFGARMLAKMGWQAGTGLGTTGEGIVTPVESKLRPQKIGIAFKGFKEKTEQSKMEARRRGEVVSDDEGGKKKGGRGKKAQEKERSDVWKKPKKVRTKVEHKTYEQIIAEAGQDTPPPGIGQIIDATGAVPREVSSLADVSLNSWSPSNDPTRIPEVRHNIRLIGDACKSDLDGLAREARQLDERKKWALAEDVRLKKKIEDEAELIARLQQIQIVANEINTKSRELTSSYDASLEPFSPLFYKLIDQFSREFERYRLDEIVVAAIAPLVRRMVAQWNPLEEPMAFVSTFRTWRRALKLNPNEKSPHSEIDVYGSKTTVVTPSKTDKPMTPFESLLWNVWLPRVRSCINNDWSPSHPHPAVKLFEAWASFLPPFIRDNLLDQLILPKVQKAVENWKPKTESVSLQTFVFPWLPHVGLRFEEVVGDARRKVKSLLRSWVVGEDMPTDLVAWKAVFDADDWDAMLLKYVVPKLGTTLRNDFRINPRDQKIEPLQHVLQWSDILRPSIFSQLLETEFFPKWLDILHVWLIQPRVSFEEVAQWYSFWKGSFPEAVQNMTGVSRGFTRGLQLMNKAIELGPDAPTRLPRPDYRAETSRPSTPVRNGASTPKLQPRPAVRAHEITFRSIVEDFAASHDLLFIPTGRAHELSRMPLFRVSPSADGKGGLLVYILDDAVWASVKPGVGGEGDEYRAITLEDMALRAGV